MWTKCLGQLPTKTLKLAGAALAPTLAASSALAEVPNVGRAYDGQIGLMEPATEVARAIYEFHDFTNVIIILIAVFTALLMVYTMWRFSEKNNPEPSQTTHNTLLEVAWTVVPIAILVVIAVPSFKLLNMQYAYPKPDLTIKAVGYQWYWEHSYPDNGDFSIESYMLDEDGLKERRAKGLDAPRNLAVDNEIVVPVGKNVHVLVTAEDVIHNWSMPSFGSKQDAVPGRVTTTWFNAEREGIYYGQCQELCGKLHAFMPIAVRVVKQDVFDQWAAAMASDDEDGAKELIEAAALDQQKRRLAAAGGKGGVNASEVDLAAAAKD